MTPQQPPVPISDAFALQKRRNVIAFSIVLGLALTGAVVYAVKATGALGASAETAGNKSLQARGAVPDATLLRAQGANTQSVLAAPGATQAPVMQQQAQAPAQMPADVLAYLKHVEKCEQMKAEVARQQLARLAVLQTKASTFGAGMGMEDMINQVDDKNDKDPRDYIKDQSRHMPADWDALSRYFRSVRPPRECEKLALSFDKATSELSGVYSDIIEVVNSSFSDTANPQGAIAKLNAIRSNHKVDIDGEYSTADKEVAVICNRYNTRKWFTVAADVGLGGVLGLSQ
jgi:hypothetical protein